MGAGEGGRRTLEPVNRALAPRYWPGHLLALVLCGVAIGLGNWQFDGWQAGREAEARDLTRVEPVGIDHVMGPDDPFPSEGVGQPVTLQGTWVPDGTVYVSGRQNGAREGYWAVTPLALGGEGNPALLIVRGWTPDPAQAPEPPTGEAELVAWLQPPEGTSGVTDDNPNDDVLPQVRIADAIQHVDQDLYGAFAISADEVAPGDWPVGDAAVNAGTDGLTQVTPEEVPEVGQFTALRNFLYGVEWWIFGGFVVFLWWQWLRDRLRAEQAAEENEEKNENTEDVEAPGDPVGPTP